MQLINCIGDGLRPAIGDERVGPRPGAVSTAGCQNDRFGRSSVVRAHNNTVDSHGKSNQTTADVLGLAGTQQEA
jgi:hypothetical protein